MRLSRALSALIIKVVDGVYDTLPSRLSCLVSPTVFRYAACGVANYFVLDATLYYILYHYLIAGEIVHFAGFALSPHIASMVGVFPITLINGFWLNRHIAFRVAEKPAGRQLLIYVATIAGSLLLSYVVMKLLVDVCGVWATPSKLLTSLTTSLYSYLMARFVTFKH